MKKIEWNRVTWYSKLLAVLLFFIVLLLGVYIGSETQKLVTVDRQLPATAPVPAAPAVKLPSLSYITLNGYFTGQDNIVFPSFLNDLTIDRTKELGPLNMHAQLGDYEVSFGASKMTIAEAAALKARLLDTNNYSEGTRRTPNGYEGELFSQGDITLHPDAPEASASCGFAYTYLVPLADKEHVMNIGVSAAQAESGRLKPGAPCLIYDAAQYSYFKGMIDHVIESFSPSN